MAGEKVNNPELEKKMVQEAKKRGAKVLDKDIDGMGGSYTTKADTAKRSKIATDQEIGDSKYAIIHPEGKGAEIVGGIVAAKKGLDLVDSSYREGEITGRKNCIMAYLRRIRNQS